MLNLEFVTDTGTLYENPTDWAMPPRIGDHVAGRHGEVFEVTGVQWRFDGPRDVVVTIKAIDP